MKAVRILLIVLGFASLSLMVIPFAIHSYLAIFPGLRMILGIAVAILSYRYATHLGRLGIGWAIACFLFPFVALVLAFLKSKKASSRPAVKPSFQPPAVRPAAEAAKPRLVERSAPRATISIPRITQEHLSLSLVESSTLGNAGPGGAAFQQAIQHSNNQNYDGEIRSFNEALNAGLDPLRQGYAHANIGTAKLVQKRDLAGAVDEFLKVLTLKRALYESVHDAAQYMSLILQEAGREEEAAGLRQLAGKTSARLGYSLSPEAAAKVRALARTASFESKTETPRIDRPAMLTYHNKKRNLSLEYPSGWEIIWENEMDGGWEIVAGITGPQSRGGRPCVTVRMLPDAVINFFPEHVSVVAAGGPGAPSELVRTPQEYNEECKQELKHVLPGVTFIAAETGTLAGMPTATLLYSYPGKSGTIREKQINLFGKDVTYRLLGEAPEEQSESVEKYFDSLVTLLFGGCDPALHFKLRETPALT